MAARRAHNPKVAGSSPAPATKKDRVNHMVFFFLWFSSSYHLQSGVVLIPADSPTRLYMVTFVKGSPRIPS